MLILYSTVSRLAYTINERYYGGRHYVWCAPCRSQDPILPLNAASSDPWNIYQLYSKAIESGDGHADIIKSNKVGLIRGANARYDNKMISEETRQEIEQIVNLAGNDQFKPLFMVIPYQKVKGIVTTAPVAAKANPLSQEFIITDLPRKYFDIWPWHS